MTPEEIITEMKRGNERFRKGETRARDFLKEQKASAKGQYPAVVVLSCIDSRAAAYGDTSDLPSETRWRTKPCTREC